MCLGLYPMQFNDFKSRSIVFNTIERLFVLLSIIEMTNYIMILSYILVNYIKMLQIN